MFYCTRCLDSNMIPISRGNLGLVRKMSCHVRAGLFASMETRNRSLDFSKIPVIHSTKSKTKTFPPRQTICSRLHNMQSRHPMEQSWTFESWKPSVHPGVTRFVKPSKQARFSPFMNTHSSLSNRNSNATFCPNYRCA